MARVKLTKTLVDAIDPPEKGQALVWDSDIPGFGVRITSTGTKSWIVQMRVRGGKERRMAEDFALSPEERSQLLPSGRQTTFANRVHWAKSFLSKAGLVESTRRAHFRITERGREVLASGPDRIDNKYLSRYPEFRAFREAGGNDGDEATPVTADAPVTLPPAAPALAARIAAVFAFIMPSAIPTPAGRYGGSKGGVPSKPRR